MSSFAEKFVNLRESRAANSFRRARNYTKRLFRSDPDAYLKQVRGVIHIGANVGQERENYAKYNLNVLWIEPIPAIFRELAANIASYSKQKGIQALIIDQDDRETILHVSNNGGASSSIFDFHKHKDIWPEVRYTHDITIKSMSLPTLLRSSGIALSEYDCLVLDTQGSELLVLKGAETILGAFSYIKTEAADFESYRGSTQVGELIGFLAKHSFSLKLKDRFAKHKDGGSYCDLLFVNTKNT
jgi:FkbM family methyltransferase